MIQLPRPIGIPAMLATYSASRRVSPLWRAVSPALAAGNAPQVKTKNAAANAAAPGGRTRNCDGTSGCKRPSILGDRTGSLSHARIRRFCGLRAPPAVCWRLRLVGNTLRLTLTGTTTIAPRHPQTVGIGGAQRAGPRGTDGLLTTRVSTMAWRCELTGKTRQVGHRVSHSNRKTKRRFLPNLLNVTLISDALGRSVRLRISANALKSVDHRGGLDAFLLAAKDADLSPRALEIKRQVAKKRQATA